MVDGRQMNGQRSFGQFKIQSASVEILRLEVHDGRFERDLLPAVEDGAS